MKKGYVQPVAEVFEVSTENLVMDGSIPGGGEVGFGGRGPLDAAQHRSPDWDDYEKSL